MRPQATRPLRRRETSGLTLLELLVALAIIGLLAGISLPALRGFGQSNKMSAANQQLLADLAIARQRAIRDRTTVYLVFMPPADQAGAALFTPLDGGQKTNLLTGQQTSYALFSFRSVGEQPGRENPRYVREWQSLPDGIFIPAWKFKGGAIVPDFNSTVLIPEFSTRTEIPVPDVEGVRTAAMPFIAFDHLGRVLVWNNTAKRMELTTEDEVIPLARGSIFYARLPDGTLDWDAPDAAERPPFNSISNYNLIVLDKLTGRARVQRPEIQ